MTPCAAVRRVSTLPEMLDRAAEDPSVRGCLALYIKLHRHLSNDRFRPAKLVTLARELRVTEGRVSQALDTLEERGYLRRGPSDGTANTYQLLPETVPELILV